MACRNGALARQRAYQREQLLIATEVCLAVIQASVAAGRLSGQDKIGVRVGKVIDKYKVAKHFELQIGENSLKWTRKQEGIDAEAAFDGLFPIGTTVIAAQMTAPDCVRDYRSLAMITRNTCRSPNAVPDSPTFDLLTTPTAHQQRAFALVQAIGL